MSGYNKDAPEIILDDIDSLINIKKEGSQDAPKSSSFVPTPKTVRASSIKKRKTIEPSPFDGLDPDQIPAKMLSLVTLGCQKVTEGFQQAALCHAELQQAAHDKNFYINNLQRDLDNLKGELAATKLRHAEELARFKDGTKQSIVVLVLQARIKMALEAQDVSFDRSSWDVDGWIKRLEELGGQAVEGAKKDPVAETPADPEGKGKAVAEGGGAPVVVTQGNEDVIDKV